MSILAVIPARGGSKGVPEKNIRELNGIPLIAHTILAAKKVNRLSKVIVSTDSEKIAEVSRHYGAEVPFIRPDYLATDTASSIDVVMHTIEYFKQTRVEFNDLILLQPTSPLRDEGDIDNSLDLYLGNKCDSVVSVCEAETNPYLFKRIDDEGTLHDFIAHDNKHMRRQDMPKLYRLNGAIYITSVRLLEEKRSFYGNVVLPYIMNSFKSIDIDNEIDFELAELFMKRIK